MVLWIGIDDTDSLRGMCTTFLATELVRDLTRDHDLIGYPRLVRLNPNIPWKTRGNGALCLRFGRGVGIPQLVGNIDGREVLAFPGARGEDRPREIRARVASLVERWSAFEDQTTNPAFAILQHQPPQGLYWKAVRSIVSRAEARRAARRLGILKGYKNGRGVVGAIAAIAWRPRDRTYEVLTYRHPSLWGLRREIDSASVKEMDRAFPSTFNNFDYDNEKVVVTPHSPCPVLFGIRGDVPGDLLRAMAAIRGERPERWLLFETNQGTDDHVVPNDWSLRRWTATSIEGTIASPPQTQRGGHTFFQLHGRSVVTVAAYEPSKQFRDVVRALRPGDRVRVYGSVRDAPRTLNLEKLAVLALAVDSHEGGNPRCPVCGKSMKSLGYRAGFRCLRERTRVPFEDRPVMVVPRAVTCGFFEPPACARRHLSKPLARMPVARGVLGQSSEPVGVPILSGAVHRS